MVENIYLNCLNKKLLQFSNFDLSGFNVDLCRLAARRPALRASTNSQTHTEHKYLLSHISMVPLTLLNCAHPSFLFELIDIRDNREHFLSFLLSYVELCDIISIICTSARSGVARNLNWGEAWIGSSPPLPSPSLFSITSFAPPPVVRGSGGLTPGKFVICYIAVGEFWCILNREKCIFFVDSHQQ